MGFSRQEYWSGLPFPSPHSRFLLAIYLDRVVCIFQPQSLSLPLPFHLSLLVILSLFAKCVILFLLCFSSSSAAQSCLTLYDPWISALQASLSITNSRNSPKPMSIQSVVPYNHLILCRPLLLMPSIFPSIRVFSNESALRIRWPKYWSFSFSISPSNEHPDWSPLGLTGWISLQSKGLSRDFSNTTVQKH